MAPHPRQCPCLAATSQPCAARWASDLIGNAGSLHRAIEELAGLRRLARRDDAVVMGREPADRIRRRRVARKPQRLAAAAAPVHLLPSERARPAWLLHPVRPAEAREGVGLAP